ncbi:MMPL family transporter [Streptomyces sp. 6N223]|uniref:MMPL family transporter n=1 Tax=Streptomyces sp. 6N223 TaxID=3457412 RepID=UPI003FD36DC7
MTNRAQTSQTSLASTKNGLAARLGGWSTRHRKTAILGWLLFVVLTAVVGGASGFNAMSDSEVGSGDSQRAAEILEDAGLTTPAGELVMLRGDEPNAWREAARELSVALEGTGEVTNLQPPIPSSSGREALITFDIAGDPDTAPDRVGPVIDAVDALEGVETYQFGEASGDKAVSDLLSDDFRTAEMTAVPLALGILLIVFGALVAALLPVFLALTACIATLGLLALASHQVPLFETTNSVMFLVGLAVGVDYCLFYLRRERDERAAGRDPETALRIAAETSGRAVLVSGLTVMLAMSGMFLSGLLLFHGFAVATVSVVLVAMLGSVTVLPAMLSWLGDRINAGRVPLLHRRRASGGLSGKLMRPVLSHPKAFAIVAGAALLALCAPALTMKTEQLGLEKQFGSDSPLTIAYAEITSAFPDGPAPAEVVVRADDVTSAEFTAALRDFENATDASNVTLHESQNIARIEVPLKGDDSEALDTLRDELVPTYLEPVSEEAYVTGELAESTDFTDQLSNDIFPILLYITVVTFLVMLLSFRSLPIAVASIVLNLLSVGAAYGVMTAVFQHGWGAETLGMEPAGAIEAWMPLFVLVILFGLSMDYHVFVVSRIREAHERGLPANEAIREGIRATAGSVTGAAVIMVAVFSVFALLQMQDMQQMGVGLAVAVLLDATLVRMVLLPSILALLGDRAWPRRRRSVPRHQQPLEPPIPVA